MYPRNAATPPVIDLGEIVLKSDGTQQTTGVSARVKIGTGAWGTAANSPACDVTSGIWTYGPSQAETNADFFIVALYKASCTSISKTVITSNSDTSGTVLLAPVTHTSAVLPNLDAAVSSRMASYTQPTGFLAATFPTTVSSYAGGAVASVTAGVTLDSGERNTLVDLVWDEAMSGHTTSGTYGGRIVRATNSNTEVQITGSNHIAADVHEFQAGVITAGAFAANSLTASALAADAVTEIQLGLATQISVDAIQSDTNDIQTRLPASLESGRIAAVLDSTGINSVADGILKRNVSNVEATAAEHTLATAILSLLEWSISGGDLIIKRTDGTTTHYTKTLSSATGTGDVITGLN